MNTQLKTNIKKEDLSVMEELAHQCNFRLSELEAICPAQVYGWDVELEVYPPGESYPSYFRVHYYLFSEFADKWYSENDIDSHLRSGWLPPYDKEGLKDSGVMYWYQNLATDKDQIEVTNYVINQLFNQIF